MADQLIKCTACDGRGYYRCECWPGDCICGQDEDTCLECDGEGVIDPFFYDPLDCECSNHETDLLEGQREADALTAAETAPHPADGGENGAGREALEKESEE
jgi:hypothetical protein